ncbi:MAG TPA: hypothetical protein VK460_05910 [Burkholderiales bacterium]|nr:hypothetical protein [Burkholderiales bacterium]
MVDSSRCAGNSPRPSERGQALILILILLGLLSGMVVFNALSGVTLTAERNNITALALAQAKQALIGYAASDNNFPGSLPCPDTNNNGSADLYAGSDCPGYVGGSNVYLGRLPWRTLGLPDLRDSSGERLWYAVSRNFALNPTCMPNCPLNSDTLGQLTVTGIAPNSNAVAIIFAPGAPLGSQARDAANQNTAANYLEGENADGTNSIFTTAANSSTFNDRLLVLTNVDLMPAVERRVAREMMSILQQYKAATAVLGYNGGAGVYPWADRSDGNSDGWSGDAYNHARFPCGTALPEDWGTNGTPSLPGWLTNGCTSPVTGWTSVIYYAVAKNRLENTGSICSNCSASTLTVTNSNNGIADLCLSASVPFTCNPAVVSSGSADLVLITPGAATAYPRCGSPPCWPTSNFNPIIGYFEDAENSDNSNDNYVVPSSTNNDHDRIYIVR